MDLHRCSVRVLGGAKAPIALSQQKGNPKKNPKPELGGATRRTEVALTCYRLAIGVCEVKDIIVPERAAFYIDGFNLYHAINDLGLNYIKWNSLWSLAQGMILSRSQTLVKATFCTAYYPNDSGKRARHEKYIRAQKHFGVSVVMGHYVHEDTECRSCGNIWKKPTEKETDINVSLQLIDDAYNDVFDHAYLVSNDSDQAATVKLFAARFMRKKLTVVCPPGRQHSKHLLSEPSVLKATITLDHMEKAVMDGQIHSATGLIVRPKEYDPPPDWIHPKSRPR